MYLGNFLLAQFISQQAASESSCKLISCHIERILQTTAYAVGQANNHVTSEAAGLYLAGAFLEQHCNDSVLQELAKKALKKGLYLLERAVKKLILPPKESILFLL